MMPDEGKSGILIWKKRVCGVGGVKPFNALYIRSYLL